MEKKMIFGSILKNGFAFGMKNVGLLLVNFVLYILTIWIPYLNVGTTIGLSVGVITKMAKGEMISAVEIFNPKYRKFMGEYFLGVGFKSMGILIGIVSFIIPGFVIGIAWSLSLYLIVDKGVNPVEALSLSNKKTYGYKATIFFSEFVVSLIGMFASFVTAFVYYDSYELSGLLILISIILFILCGFVLLGIKAAVYKALVLDDDKIADEKVNDSNATDSKN